MRIFISYRRADASGHAGRLFDALEARFGRGNVFMDVSGIASGQNFVEAIHTAVHSCDALVAVIGDEWLTCTDDAGRRLDSPDDFVRAEIAAALDRGIPVIPVLVEQTAMPSAAALPASLKALATRQAHELTDARWSYDVARLLDALEKLGRKAQPWPAPAGRRRLAVAAAVVVAVAVLGAAVFWSRGDGEEVATTPADERASTNATGAGGAAPDAATVPASALAGEWEATVTYSWGATHPERFTFNVGGGHVLGTASYLRVRRGILDGTLTGNRVVFTTKTQMIAGDDPPQDLTHHYRGTISGDTIAFYMQTEGPTPYEPIEFTATRVRTGGESAPSARP